MVKSYLSLQADELDGLANRVALLLARLETMPPEQKVRSMCSRQKKLVF